MLALVYRIILAILSLSDLVGPRNRNTPRFKRVILELVVYPILLIGITVWLVVLVFIEGVNWFDFPAIVAIVVAQETVIDLIVVRVSKKLDVVIKDEEKA